MSQNNESLQFSAYVGIDWADKKHDICLLASGSSQLEFQMIKHSPQAIEQWMIDLNQRFQGGRIAVCLEQTKGPLIYALLKYDFLILYPINPQSLANDRKAFALSGAKDDPSDAALQLDFMIKHQDKLNP